MRKLTMLASTVVAAVAIGVAAAPAQADVPFAVANANGTICNPICHDTGYEGQLDVKNSSGVLLYRCDVDFDVEIDSAGAFNTYNTNISACNGFGTYPCDDSWPGQLRLPDGSPMQVDLEVCVGPSSYTQDVTFNALNNPRRWTQISTPPLSSSYVELGTLYDANSADNIKILF